MDNQSLNPFHFKGSLQPGTKMPAIRLNHLEERQADDLPAPFPTAITTRPVVGVPAISPVPAPIPAPGVTTPLPNGTATRTIGTPTSQSGVGTTVTRATGTGGVTTSKSTLSSSSTSTTSKTSVTASSSSIHPTTTVVKPPEQTEAQSWIYPNSFPADFPVQTVKPEHKISAGRGYAFLKHNELADSMLIFAAFLVVSLILSIILIKWTQFVSRRRGSKGDQMVSEDMKWQERREVVERKIVYESGKSGGGGNRPKAAGGAGMGWRELSELERLTGKGR